MTLGVALLAAGAVAAIASTAVTVVAASQQASAARQANRAAAQQSAVVTDYNVAAAQNQAQQVRNAAAVEEDAYRRTVRRAQAANRAAIGASGVDMSGSPLLVLMDNAEQAEYEAQRIKQAGAQQAATLESQADLENYYGQSAAQAYSREEQAIGRKATGAYVGAGTSLLSSGANLTYSYYSPKLFNQRPSSQMIP